MSTQSPNQSEVMPSFSLFLVINKKQEVLNVEKHDLQSVVQLPNNGIYIPLFSKLDKDFIQYKNKFLQNKDYGELPDNSFIRIDIPDIKRIPKSEKYNSEEYVQNVLLPAIDKIAYLKSFREEWVDRQWEKIKPTTESYFENMFDFNETQIERYKNIPSVTEKQLKDVFWDPVGKYMYYPFYIEKNHACLRALKKTVYYRIHKKTCQNIDTSAIIEDIEVVSAYLSGQKEIGNLLYDIFFAGHVKNYRFRYKDNKMIYLIIHAAIFNFLKQNPHNIEFERDFTDNGLDTKIYDKNLTEIFDSYLSLIQGNEFCYQNVPLWNKNFLRVIQGVLNRFDSLEVTKFSDGWKKRFEDLRNNFQYLVSQDGFNEEAMYLKFRELENKFGCQLHQNAVKFEFLNHFSTLNSLDEIIEKLFINEMKIISLKPRNGELPSNSWNRDSWLSLKEACKNFYTKRNALSVTFYISSELVAFDKTIIKNLCFQFQKEAGLPDSASVTTALTEGNLCRINMIISNLTPEHTEILPYTGIITIEKVFCEVAAEKHLCLSYDCTVKRRISKNLSDHLKGVSPNSKSDKQELNIKH